MSGRWPPGRGRRLRRRQPGRGARVDQRDLLGDGDPPGNVTQNLLPGPRDRVAAAVAPLDSVDGLAVDTAGNVVISDALDYLVWVVAARAGNGTEEFRGDGCLATTAWLLSPVGLAGRPGRRRADRRLRQPADPRGGRVGRSPRSLGRLPTSGRPGRACPLAPPRR